MDSQRAVLKVFLSFSYEEEINFFFYLSDFTRLSIEVIEFARIPNNHFCECFCFVAIGLRNSIPISTLTH